MRTVLGATSPGTTSLARIFGYRGRPWKSLTSWLRLFCDSVEESTSRVFYSCSSGHFLATALDFSKPPATTDKHLLSFCCFIIQYIHIAQIYIYNFIPVSTAEWSVGLSFENCQSRKCISCFGGEKSAESLSKFKWSRNSAIPHPRDSTQQDVQPQRNAQNEASQSPQSQSSIVCDSPVQIAFGLHTSYTAPEHVL